MAYFLYLIKNKYLKKYSTLFLPRPSPSSSLKNFLALLEKRTISRFCTVLRIRSCSSLAVLSPLSLLFLPVPPSLPPLPSPPPPPASSPYLVEKENHIKILEGFWEVIDGFAEHHTKLEVCEAGRKISEKLVKGIPKREV